MVLQQTKKTCNARAIVRRDASPLFFASLFNLMKIHEDARRVCVAREDFERADPALATARIEREVDDGDDDETNGEKASSKILSPLSIVSSVLFAPLLSPSTFQTRACDNRRRSENVRKA